MRNLKRALSLALASVMLLGMMVVGTSAASYPDVDDKNNVEAIAVLEAVKVMIGNEKGEFEPDKNVTRNEMAVIMAKLILGTYEADSYVGSHPFTDVPDWASRYVAACYNSGIIAGRSDTTYDGNSTVTAVEAAAMMLRALGYEDLSKGADQWDRPVAAKANEIRLFKDVGSSATAPMNRNQVAQLALNALKADVVTTTSGSNIDLGEIGSITTDVKYEKVGETKANDYRTVGDDQDEVQQLCEKLYGGDLTLKSNDTDDFGRPATTWQYKKDPVVTAAKEAEAVFTAKTSNANVLKELKGLNYNGKKINVENDIKVIADLTANGKLVEIFASDNTITDVIETSYAVAKVTNVSTNKDGDVTYTLDNGGGTGRIYADPDKDDTIVIDGSIGKDDIVTFTKASSVLYVYPTTTFTGAQDSWKVATAGRAGTIVVDGETYDVGLGLENVTMDGTKDKFPNSEDEANFYVDQFGYVVKSDAIETNTDYAVLDGIIYKAADGLKGKPYAQANLVLADGTMLSDVKVVKINGLDLTKDAGYSEASAEADVKITNATANTFTALALSKTVAHNAVFKGVIVSYSEDNNEYTLTVENVESKNSAAPTFTLKGELAGNNTNAATAATKGDPTVTYGGGTSTTTGSTVFVVKTDDDEYTAYTGFRNVPTIKTGTASTSKVYVTVVKDDNKAELVYIDATGTGAQVGDESGDILYLVSKTPSISGKDKDRVYTAIVNGEKTTVMVKSGTTAVNNAFASGENKLFELTYDADGYVTEADAITTSGKWHVGVALADDVNSDDGVIAAYTYDGSETVIAIEDGDVIDGATVETAEKGDTIWVKTKGDSGADAKAIDTIYIVKDGEKSLAGGTSAEVIEAALADGGKATLPAGALAGNVSVPENSTLTITGAVTGAGKITVEEGATLVVKGGASVAGGVTVNAGATVNTPDSGHATQYIGAPGSDAAIQLESGTIEITSAKMVLSGEATIPHWVLGDTIELKSGTEITVADLDGNGTTATIANGVKIIVNGDAVKKTALESMVSGSKVHYKDSTDEISDTNLPQGNYTFDGTNWKSDVAKP